MNGSRRIAGLIFLGALCISASASAQRAAPDARGYGLATAYSARARGHESPFWNPANLGLSRNPDWSVGLNASAYFSNNALSYGEITDLYGEYLDAAEKSRLLADVRAAIPLRGTAGRRLLRGRHRPGRRGPHAAPESRQAVCSSRPELRAVQKKENSGSWSGLRPSPAHRGSNLKRSLSLNYN